VNLNELGESVIKVAGNKLVKTKVVNLSYLFEETKIINVRTHLVDSDINIIGRTVIRKLGFRLMYMKENSEKEHPKIQEEFYTQEELDEIKKYLPRLLELVNKLKKHRGLSKLRPMKIEFKDRKSAPIWICQKFLNKKDMELFRTTIQKFIDLGLIRKLSREEYYSEYNFQLLKIPKGKKYSILLDLRPLNELIVDINFEIPLLQNLMKNLSRYSYYFLIDLSKAYCQLVYISDKNLFCFSIGVDRYAFEGLSYGVKSVSSYFSLVLQETFIEIINEVKEMNANSVALKIYFDDIIKNNNSIKDHFIVAEKVLLKLDEKEIRINPSKAKFFQKSLKNFGRIFSQSGSTIDVDQVLDINFDKAWYSKKDIKSIIGMTGFFRSNVIGMSTYNAELHEMIKNLQKQFQEKEEEQERSKLS
jgi:hypothetical protein